MGGGLDPKAMARAAGMPAGMSPRMPAGAMAKARMMGYAPPTGKPIDKAKLREKRKRERQNRKKNRKRR
jgi:signal recognition particle subunit SRP54